MSKTYSVQPNYAIYYRSASLHNPTSTPTINTHNQHPQSNTHNQHPQSNTHINTHKSTPTINTHINTEPPFNTPLICTILGASLHNPASTPTSPPYPGRAFSHLPAPATQQHQTPFNTPPSFAPSWVPHYTTPHQHPPQHRTPAAPPLFPPLQATASRPPPTPPRTAPPLCGSSSQRQGAPQ